MIHGGSWECGYCGDSGFLRRRVPRKREVPQITLTLSLSWDLDLNDTWEELKKTVRDLTGSRSDMPLSLLGRTILHEISLGMVRAQKHPSDARLKKIEAFLYDTNDLCARCSLNDLIGTVKTGNAMYSDEAALTDQKCGKFWRSLMQAIPTYAYYTDNSLQDLFRNLSNWYTLGFSEAGEGSSDRQWELEETFQKYWSEYVLLNPDVAFAKKRLQSADLSPREDYCKEIIIGTYLEKFVARPTEEVEELSWEDAIREEWEKDPMSAIGMWRTLLDAAGAGLKNRVIARTVLPNFIEREWLKQCDAFRLQPLLDALEEERFAGQVFQSAHVGRLQLDILRTCNYLERTEQGEKLYHLLMKNPLPREQWEMPPEKYADGYQRGLSGRQSKPQYPATDSPDNTIYRYCMVKTPKSDRVYSYLSGEQTVNVGDMVEVPFGKDGNIILAEVVEIRSCTAANAPWPPERTKSIIRIAAQGEKGTEVLYDAFPSGRSEV